LVLGAWCLVLGAWCLVLGAWCLVLGAWCLVLGAWCLVLGAWWSTIIAINADRENSAGLTSAPVQDYNVFRSLYERELTGNFVFFIYQPRFPGRKSSLFFRSWPNSIASN
jgi:hypothetical protein